ncbi:MAG: chromophore lyase CpcT/CpeT [Steroidobacterales bacterium]
MKSGSAPATAGAAPRRALRSWPAWCLTALALAGCTTEATKRQADFDKLIQKLPGQYDNLAQAQGDASGAHAALALLIRPVNALTVGRIVFFVRETAADDPRRVLSQHIWTFEIDKKNRLVQTIYAFKEPRRWLHAAEDPYVIQSVLPDDLSALTGCELTWTKSGEDFRAATEPDTCKESAGAEGSLMEQSAELRDSELVLNERLSGGGGPDGTESASSYRFQRRAAATPKQ